jgi:hypothetical protein
MRMPMKTRKKTRKEKNRSQKARKPPTASQSRQCKGLLLDLVSLLLGLLLSLIQIGKHNITSIAQHPQLKADSSDTHLDEAIVVVRLAVLVLPGTLDIVDGRVGVLLELLGVLLDNGEVGLEC